MSTAPASIGRVAGYENPLGWRSPAHLTLVDPTAVAPEPHGSLSRNNPYQGEALKGRVVHTFYTGTQTVDDGEAVDLPERTA
jgi:dihydroorotase